MSWAMTEIVDAVAPGALSLGNLAVAVLFVPALLANDMERTSPPEVLIGTLLAATTTLSVMLVMSGVVDGAPIDPWAWLLCGSTVGVLVWPRAAAAVATRRAAVRLDTGQDRKPQSVG